MRAFKVLTLTVLLAIVAVGCSKVEKILPKKEGTWKTTSSVSRVYVNSALDTTITTTSGLVDTYKFEKDGIGTYTDADTSVAFTWAVNDDQDEVTMCFDFAGLQICSKSTVLESEKDKQVWTSTDKVDGDVDWTETDATLERVD